jgi:Sulfotransferase family
MSTAAEQSPTTPQQQLRIPRFFIVGHAKCGTTALYEMLRRHPQIYMPDSDGVRGKEPWYFARDNPQPQTSPKRSVAYTGRKKVTLEEYLSLFAAAQPGQVIGEASTSYLWSLGAPGRIAQMCPDARIIAIIREPASFLRSLHLQLLQNHSESEKDFRKAVELDQLRREDREIPKYSYWPAALIYSDRVRYVEQLRRYEELFGRDRILVLIYDDFRRDNEATVRRILSFLGVDDTHPVPAIEANPTIGVRSVQLDTLKHELRSGSSPALRAARLTLKALTTRGLRKRMLYPLQRRLVYRKPPPPDEQFMQELRRRFKGEVEALSEYLNRDLVALWGYDRIG